MEDNKLDKILEFIDEAKKDSSWHRILSLMEAHPIISVIVIYIFVSKIAKVVSKT